MRREGIVPHHGSEIPKASSWPSVFRQKCTQLDGPVCQLARRFVTVIPKGITHCPEGKPAYYLGTPMGH